MKIALVVSVRIPEGFTKEIISELVLKKLVRNSPRQEEEIGISAMIKACAKEEREGKNMAH